VKPDPHRAATPHTVVDGPSTGKLFVKWSAKDVSEWARETGIGEKRNLAHVLNIE